MAKRFTDTKKFDKDWFRLLPIKMKVAWDYLTCRCDHAGFWDLSLERMKFETGAAYTVEELIESLDVILVDDKLFLPGFIPFQYGCKIEDLNPENRVHRSVLKELEKYDPSKLLHSPIDTPSIDLASPIEGAKDKDKDKEKDKKKGECEGETRFDFESLYQLYPRREGKAEGMTRLRKRIRTREDFERFASAVRKYAGLCRTENRKREHILLWSSFVGSEGAERWLDHVPAPRPLDTPTAFKVTAESFESEASSDSGRASEAMRERLRSFSLGKAGA